MDRSQATLLVCEDDPVTLEFLADNLTADAFEVLTAADVSDALRHLRFSAPDAVVLDLGLPDGSGLDLLRSLRAGLAGAHVDAAVPVLVLSGRGGDRDRVRGLEAGADDYLCKPVHYPELLARLRAVLRRARGRRTPVVRVGGLEVCERTRRVAVDGREVPLSNREFSLLCALASDPERVFTKGELLRDVWGYRAEGRTRTVDAHASRLRRKLAVAGGRFVVNVWGVGYRLCEEISP